MKVGKLIRIASLMVMSLFMLPLVSAAQDYSSAVIADGPLVYWGFNNDLSDAMGNIDLDPAASPQFVDGPLDGSLAYSSSDGQAWAASFGTVELNELEDFSYEMWINLSGDNEGKHILQRIGLGEDNPGENSIIYRNGAVEFFTSRSDELELPAVVELPDQTDAWHHFVVTYNYQDAVLILYADGQPAYVDEFALLSPFYGGNDFEVYIGASRYNPEENTFNGQMDEIAIYGKTLTADEVASHFAAGDDYASAVTADEPLVYWRFEENFDDEMGLYDLMPSGVNFVQGPGSAANKALFGRVTSDQAELLYEMTDFTYEFWFNPINRSSQSYIFFRLAGASQHSVIYAYNPNALEFFFANGNVRPLVEIPNETDQWHHCVVVNDAAANEMRIYMNGELAVSENSSAVPGSGNKIVVGGSDQGDNFNGYIDEFAVYDFVLSEEQITTHFDAPFFSTAVNDWALF
ncbi:MAG: LamG domain-containing protein [Candidatus Omnitrophica bacterium]|nr:LamG domain-containing protein [Candidatus Omnitrophota bacterium]